MDENTRRITPTIFRNAMQELLGRCEDHLSDQKIIYHTIFEGTMLLCTVLRQHGYKEGIELFKKMCMIISHSNNLVTTLN